MFPLFSGFWLFLLAAIPARSAPAATGWEELQGLAAGTEVEIVHGALQKMRGRLVEVRNDGLVVRTGLGEQTVAREGLLRVSLPGTARRGRNALLGAAIGGAAAMAFSWIALEVGDADIRRDLVVLPFSGLGAGVGAGVGAAVSHNRTVYRAPASARKP